jgi:hypothetical protein
MIYMIVYYNATQIILTVLMMIWYDSMICIVVYAFNKSGLLHKFYSYETQIQTAAKVKVFSCFALLLPLTKSVAAK